MANNIIFFDCFFKNVAEKVHNLHSDTLKVYLSNTTPDTAADTIKTDLAEISAGNGYTAGGADTTNTVSRSGTLTKVNGVNVTWTASGGSIGPFRYLVLYNDDATNDPLIGYWDIGSACTVLVGDYFRLKIDTDMIQHQTVSGTFFQCYTEDLTKKVHNLSSDTLKIYLSNTAPDAANDLVKADLAEIASGNGYTAGGHDTQNTGSAVSVNWYIFGTTIDITASGGSIGPFRYLVLYNDDSTSDSLIRYWDHGSAITLTAGMHYVITFDSVNGMLEVYYG